MSRNRRNGEPWLSLFGSWAVLGASFALSADTWILLAELAGFTRKLSIPNTDMVASLAWLMPICVDGYVVVALTLWMSPVPARVARFAKVNTYVAASFGIAAQGLYHLLMTMSTASEDWQIFLAAVVGALPPALAGLSIHMRALIRRESNRTGDDPTPAPSRVAGLVSLIGQVRQAMAPIPAPTTPIPATVPVPATVPSPATPSAPAVALSTVDTSSAARTVPSMAAAEPVSYPSPAEVAARITPAPTPSTRPTPTAKPGPVQRSTRSRTSTPTATTAPLTPASTDSSVAAKTAVQPMLPMVAPALLERASEVARLYRTEHGTRIKPGPLAVRLRVTTEQAAQLLATLDDTPSIDTTVNGSPVKAA